ncbi:MAG: hypothetical protein A2513_04360 [Sulfurimonas sp. RIFOXYD12_FULL_33_39]|nr:MAG: hypothetical protein A2513_04360 [Sulfurimonas sp. RIFOXYD12_FULL_33_39]OHE13040.1 MAG: hypothetical protein A2530_04445 [Sulfurimonas sp. RIFOXYD2_FULL_34_21]DAB27330.1 MAG TPA: hypothetical protein CFH78_08370 [Sulfurimonas sp. UBA10385]
MYYGLISQNDIYKAVDRVVECLGGGAAAKMLLLETSAAETDMGDAHDLTWNTGIGLMQFDKIGFDDVKIRTSQAKKQKVKECFGVDIDKVIHTDLRWSPLLSVIFARLKYLLVPNAIPNTIGGRAEYWKRWYNSSLGKGTPEHYLAMAQKNNLIA